ncbi:hypothetical protein WBG78_13925 [Chryseolinea sp. T2]|uniref:hypothetical protein n=1 Tax=Chryseolinea sp. T2 TaxID=3129255 RepID=UPI003077D8BB
MELGSMIQRSLKLQDIRVVLQRYFNNACSEDELSLVHYWYTLLTKRCYDRDELFVSLEERIWAKVSCN